MFSLRGLAAAPTGARALKYYSNLLLNSIAARAHSHIDSKRVFRSLPWQPVEVKFCSRFLSCRCRRKLFVESWKLARRTIYKFVQLFCGKRLSTKQRGRGSVKQERGKGGAPG